MSEHTTAQPTTAQPTRDRPTIDEPTIARGETADLIEQSLGLVPDLDDETPVTVSWESDPADVAEQQRDVGTDDERDEDHQT